MADDIEDVSPGSSAGSDVKATAPAPSASAGDTETDSPPATKASDAPTPPPGKSHREALIASLSNEKKEEPSAAPTKGEDDDEEPEGGTPTPTPTAEAEGEEAAEVETPEGDETEVSGKPERAKKDVLIENIRKVSAEKKALEPFQRFAAPILQKLQAAKLPPAEFHALTDLMISARGRGVPVEKLKAWVDLGTENLSADDAGQRLFDLAVQHGYKPEDRTPKVSDEDEAWVRAQEKAGLIDGDMAADLRKRLAKTPPPAARRPPPQQAPPQRQSPPPDAGGDSPPSDAVPALARIGNYADAVRKQHKISEADWEQLDKGILAKLNKAKADAGGAIPTNLWFSTFKLVTDAAVADFLRRKPSATKKVQTSLRPSPGAGTNDDAGLSERQKVIHRLAGS